MPKYRKKPIVVEASQWLKSGDHPAVRPFLRHMDRACPICGTLGDGHGECPTLEGRHIVCPGDFVITGIRGEHYPCKPDIFAATYEAVPNA